MTGFTGPAGGGLESLERVGPRHHNWDRDGGGWVPRDPAFPRLEFPPESTVPHEYQGPVAGHPEGVPLTGWRRTARVGQLQTAPRAVMWVRARHGVDARGGWTVVGGWDAGGVDVSEWGWDPIRLRDRVCDQLVTVLEQRRYESVYLIGAWEVVPEEDAFG